MRAEERGAPLPSVLTGTAWVSPAVRPGQEMLTAGPEARPTSSRMGRSSQDPVNETGAWRAAPLQV